MGNLRDTEKILSSNLYTSSGLSASSWHGGRKAEMLCTSSWATSCIRAWEGSTTGVLGCRECREQEHNLNPSFRSEFTQSASTVLVTARVLNIYNSSIKNLLVTKI